MNAPKEFAVPQLKDQSLLRSHCYLDGAWVDADSGKRFNVDNPGDGSMLGSVPDMGAAEARRAIEAANAALPAWRKVVAAATAAGHPVPALSASLGWFDTMRQGRGTAALNQAQRDFFGAHTYRRVDAPEEVVHTEWERLRQL